MKNFKFPVAVFTIIGALLTLPARAAESLSVLLQKAIYAEETEGNLDSAIKLYEQIATEIAADRPLAAQAQYRLAVCYQKKGNKEQAIKLLNELVQQSPRDAAINKKARETLAELGQAPSAAITIRKIPLSVSVQGIWSVSPDGRLISYIPHGGHDLMVYEIATGKTWTIVKGTGEKLPWNSAIFSPDGQRIAYDLSGSTIHISKTDGAETRKFYERKGGNEWPEVLGWTPDGTQLIVASRFDREPFLVFGLDTKTGARTEIAQVPTVAGQDLWHLSSDGNSVARRTGYDPRRITLLDLKSGREETLVEKNIVDFVGWAPSGAALLYTKNRTDAIDLWSIGMNKGKPSGEPELVWSNLGKVFSLGITQNGSIYYCTPRPNKTDDASLWVMEGFLTKKAPAAGSWRMPPEISPEEITGPNHSILDRKYGLSATLPAGWTISWARRVGGGVLNFINLTTPAVPDSGAEIVYRATTPWEVSTGSLASLKPLNALGPKPTTSAEVDAWLRNYAQSSELKNGLKYPNYKNRAASVVSLTVGGHTALSWSADFTTEEKDWAQFFTVIYGENVIAQLSLQAPTASMDTVHPAFDRMIETVRLP